MPPAELTSCCGGYGSSLTHNLHYLLQNGMLDFLHLKMYANIFTITKVLSFTLTRRYGPLPRPVSCRELWPSTKNLLLPFTPYIRFLSVFRVFSIGGFCDLSILWSKSVFWVMLFLWILSFASIVNSVAYLRRRRRKKQVEEKMEGVLEGEENWQN